MRQSSWGALTSRSVLLLAALLLLPLGAGAGIAGSAGSSPFESSPGHPTIVERGTGGPLPLSAAPAPMATTAGTPSWTNLTGSVGSTPYAALGEQETYDGNLHAILLTEAIRSGAQALEGTFTFNGTIWVNHTSLLSSAPPGLVGPALAYDPADGYSVLFGGDHLDANGAAWPTNETWAFRAGAWVNLTQSLAPPPTDANGGALVWDAADGYLLLFDSAAHASAPTTYAFVAGHWNAVTTAQLPSWRTSASMVFDAGSSHVLLFGGRSPSALNEADTWAYAGGLWSNLTSASGTAPEGGAAAGMVWDTTTSQVEMVLGHREVCVGLICTSVDARGLWSYSQGLWQNLSTQVSGAAPLGGGPFAFDPMVHQSILMGLPGAPGAGSTWSLQFLLPPVTVSAPVLHPFASDLGSPVNLSTTPSGGSGNYGYRWSGLPPGCASANRSYVICGPSSVGNFSVGANATDYLGPWVSSPLTLLTVASDPRVVSLSVSRAAVTSGAGVVLDAIVTGGSPPGNFSWTGLPGGCSSANVSSLTCTPTSPGTYSVDVHYRDLSGTFAAATVALVVNAPPSIRAFSASPSPNASEGTTLTLTVEVVGGTGTFSFNYSGLPTGCSSANSSSLACTPRGSGTFVVHATATDADGRSTTTYLVLVIAATGSGGGGLLGGASGWIYALLGVAAALLVLLLLYFWWRRRRGEERPAPADGSVPSSPSTAALEPAAAETAPSPTVGPSADEPYPDRERASALATQSSPEEAGTPSDLGPPPPPAAPPPPPRRPMVALPTPTPLSPPKGDSVCVVCGGYGQMDAATGKYYCHRCDRRY